MNLAGRFLLLSFLLVSLCGCLTTVPNELGFKAQLPAETSLTREAIQEYANQLAVKTGFPISSVIKQQEWRTEGLPMIELSVADDRDLIISIFGDPTTQSMFVTISGKIETERARSIGITAQSLFIQMHPGGHFTPFQRKRGLFGP